MALGNSQLLKDDLESVNRTLHARILSSFVETYVWYGFVYVAEAMSNATLVHNDVRSLAETVRDTPHPNVMSQYPTRAEIN